MSQQVHISSLAIHIQPERLAAFTEVAAGHPGLEVYASDPSGKLVVVLETPTEREIVDIIDDLRVQPGVLSINMVYHHAESADALAEEISHGAQTP